MRYSPDNVSAVADNAGFTLAELIVASTLIAIVMTAVYSSFSSTTRTWRAAETQTHTRQQARAAFDIMLKELSCIVGGSEHLFEGKDDEFEFFAIVPPMDLEEDEEGARVMWVRYRYNRSGKTLVREEAEVQEPLPLTLPDEEEPEEGRVKKGRKHKFVLASNVRGFDVTYYWIPPYERNWDEPPEWIEPLVKESNEAGWGLPQGIRVELTLDHPSLPEETVSFASRVTFRGPTTPYNEEKVGLDDTVRAGR